MFHEMGIRTGIDYERLLACAELARTILAREMMVTS
jgi:hypothetical protein